MFVFGMKLFDWDDGEHRGLSYFTIALFTAMPFILIVNLIVALLFYFFWFKNNNIDSNDHN